MSQYRKLVADFAQRTLDNLDFLQEQERAGAEGIFPVTQMWNSLLGLLILPYEHELERIEELSLEEMREHGWPIIKQELDVAVDLRRLLWRLRNAVAHFNVEFRGGPDGQIKAVVLTNHELPPRGSGRSQREMPATWRAVITVAELERLARLTAAHYIDRFRKAA